MPSGRTATYGFDAASDLLSIAYNTGGSSSGGNCTAGTTTGPALSNVG